LVGCLAAFSTTSDYAQGAADCSPNGRATKDRSNAGTENAADCATAKDLPPTAVVLCIIASISITNRSRLSFCDFNVRRCEKYSSRTCRHTYDLTSHRYLLSALTGKSQRTPLYWPPILPIPLAIQRYHQAGLVIACRCNV
jgi:hypothetical protein